MHQFVLRRRDFNYSIECVGKNWQVWALSEWQRYPPPSSSLAQWHDHICCSVATEEAESIGWWVSTSLSRSDVCIWHSVRRICTNFARWPRTLANCQHGGSRGWSRGICVWQYVSICWHIHQETSCLNFVLEKEGNQVENHGCTNAGWWLWLWPICCCFCNSPGKWDPPWEIHIWPIKDAQTFVHMPTKGSTSDVSHDERAKSSCESQEQGWNWHLLWMQNAGTKECGDGGML